MDRGAPQVWDIFSIPGAHPSSKMIHPTPAAHMQQPSRTSIGVLSHPPGVQRDHLHHHRIAAVAPPSQSRHLRQQQQQQGGRESGGSLLQHVNWPQENQDVLLRWCDR